MYVKAGLLRFFLDHVRVFFFANYTFCYITSTFAKTNEQNNRYDSFETRHFDEGKPCGEPPCTSLVQRSRMLMQKRPLFSVSAPGLLTKLVNNAESSDPMALNISYVASRRVDLLPM